MRAQLSVACGKCKREQQNTQQVNLNTTASDEYIKPSVTVTLKASIKTGFVSLSTRHHQLANIQR